MIYVNKFALLPQAINKFFYLARIGEQLQMIQYHFVLIIVQLISSPAVGRLISLESCSRLSQEYELVKS